MKPLAPRSSYVTERLSYRSLTLDLSLRRSASGSPCTEDGLQAARYLRELRYMSPTCWRCQKASTPTEQNMALKYGHRATSGYTSDQRRTGDWRDSRATSRPATFLRQADRFAADLRRSGGDRHRECPAVRGGPGEDRDLTESLQQQTATADVLKVISRSTFDLRDGARDARGDGGELSRRRLEPIFSSATAIFQPLPQLRLFAAKLEEFLKHYPLPPGPRNDRAVAYAWKVG